MPTYIIEQYETHAQRYTAVADDVAEAVRQVISGEVDAEVNGLEYVEVDDVRGYPIGGDRELIRRLRELNVVLDDDDESIPSIRDIVEDGEPYVSPAAVPAAGCSVSEFIAADGGICPVCRSKEIQGDSVDIDGGIAEQQVSCDECHATWVVEYRLERFRDVEDVADSGL